MKKVLISLAILALLGSGYYLYSSKTVMEVDDVTSMMPAEDGVEEMMVEESMHDDDAMMEEGEMMEEDAMMEENVKTFEVTGSPFKFDLSEITVTEGDMVKIVFTNSNGTHDLVIDEFDVRTEVTKTGETSEIAFVADQEGTFEFYCSVGNHRAQGMVGTLTVEAK